MKEFVEYVVKHLVDSPEEVKVTEVVGETTVVYELRVNRPDMGKVIGKNGRTAHAMRVLLSAVARKAGKHATLEILE
ncbi:MAG: KH domain-containing protein [candidate division KSB1 bacterium]|nr:KH domain-containing protein [candidate division KSB1 bacterium]